MSAGADGERSPAVVVRRLGVAPAVAGTMVLVVSVVDLVLSETSAGTQSNLAWLRLVVLTGLASMAVAIWVVRSDRPHPAAGLSVGMVGLAVPTWAAWELIPTALTPILLAAAPLAVAGTAHVGLAWRHLGGPPATTLVVYVLAGLGAVLIAIAYDPLADPGCLVTCARADPVAGSIVSTRAAVFTTAGLLVTAGAIAAWRLLADRRVPLVLQVSVVGSLAVLVGSWVLRAWQWGDPVPPIAIAVLPATAASLLGASVLAAWWALRRDRQVAERLITELDEIWAVGGEPGRVGNVQFWLPEENRWIDAEGRPVAAEWDDYAVVLSLGGGPAVRLWSDGTTEAKAIDDLGPGATLALANAHLAAVTRARLTEVRDSRRRIVEASDAERRRIERDLHDGAQQRLVSASLHASLAARQLSSPAAIRAQAAIGQALERLRHLAHGIADYAPTADGLRASLEVLIRSSGIPTSLVVDDLPFAADLTVTIRAAVAVVLDHAKASQARAARVEVLRSGPDEVRLRVEVDGSPMLEHWQGEAVADRIAAAGGTIRVQADATRLVLRAELPCAS